MQHADNPMVSSGKDIVGKISWERHCAWKAWKDIEYRHCSHGVVRNATIVVTCGRISMLSFVAYASYR